MRSAVPRSDARTANCAAGQVAVLGQQGRTAGVESIYIEQRVRRREVDADAAIREAVEPTCPPTGRRRVTVTCRSGSAAGDRAMEFAGQGRHHPRRRRSGAGGGRAFRLAVENTRLNEGASGWRSARRTPNEIGTFAAEQQQRRELTEAAPPASLAGANREAIRLGLATQTVAYAYPSRFAAPAERSAS